MKLQLLLVSVVSLAAAAELPVNSVVLYKHGVGYFSRAGELGPGESAQLDFQASEMNDVLKSLTISTSGAAGVAALRYDASEPVELKLAKFPIRIEPGRPLSSLLDQLKGERIELTIGSEKVTGAIVGARVQAGTQDQREREQVTLLLDSGALRVFDLSAATSVSFPDPTIELQLKDYLGVLTGARSQDKRSVYIDSTDSARRDVRVSYMIPTPVWKSSYRLLFADSGEPTLEGWAIVDNTTGDDWTNVNLALVSGRPISFITNLYEPKYINRPRAELAEDEAQKPVLYGGALGETMEAVVESESARRQRNELRQLGIADAAESFQRVPEVAPSQVASTAAARELGELFEYRFGGPVTVRKNESAMLPFLQDKITARKLLIYSDESSQHPMNAAELTNSTEKTLDGGPITVFDSGAYAGEALVETVKAGDERVISYGVDLGTRITTRFDSDRARVLEVHVRRGVLSTTSATRETKTYTIHNVDDKAKTLIIEHPARPYHRLIGQQPSEKTATAYRFEIALEARSERTFPIEEERRLVSTHAVTNLTLDVLVSYVQNTDLSAAAREQLQRILAQKRQLADATDELARTEREINELVSDQDRIRQNISSLNRVSGQEDQVQKYAAQLASQESALASLRDRQSELRRQQADLQTGLNTMVEEMEF